MAEPTLVTCKRGGGGGGGGTVNFINIVTFWCEQPCLYLTTVTDFINVNKMFIK